jgi:phage terminase large subunit
MTQSVIDRPKEEIKEVRFQMGPRQRMAWDALHDPSIDELLYGGAKGGGKSVFGCIWAFLAAWEVMKACEIGPSDYPVVVGFMGRKQSVDFSSTTLQTWKRVIPSDDYEILEQKKLIVIRKSVAIQYGGMDDSDTIKKFNSAEYAFYFVDQAEECSENDIAMLRGTLRLKVNGKSPAYHGLLTANPAICWLKSAFITNPQPRTRFIRALPTDNPFLDADYIERLRKAFAFNPPLLRAYLEGAWDGLDQAFVVIPNSDVQACVNNAFKLWNRTKKVTVVDIAEDGGDETVIYNLVNTKIESSEIYAHRDLMDSVGRIMANAKKNKSNLVCVDKVGMGAGVFSRLNEIYTGDKNMTVYGFDSRLAAPKGLNDETYANYRAYAWFKARDKFMAKEANIPDDPALIAQLSGVTWHFTAGDVMIIDAKEGKDGLKARLGGSPDRADAYVMGLDALDHADPISRIDQWDDADKSVREINPDTV